MLLIASTFGVTMGKPQEEDLLKPSLSLALTILDKPDLWLSIYGADLCERVLSLHVKVPDFVSIVIHV